MTETSIVRDAHTGEAMVAGTDVTVPDILVRLATDDGIARVVDAYPDLSREDVVAAVNFAIDASRAEAQRASHDQPVPEPATVRERGLAYGTRGVDEDIASLEERIDGLSYEIDLLKGIRDGLKDVRDGNLIPHEQVMAELRAIVSQ